ncbi:hypothetical protein XENTR_v10013812 [Xenopus tropicalis]|nr:hypothetical protein XENTR_v10013812 [Xenopus tropicalis]
MASATLWQHTVMSLPIDLLVFGDLKMCVTRHGCPEKGPDGDRNVTSAVYATLNTCFDFSQEIPELLVFFILLEPFTEHPRQNLPARASGFPAEICSAPRLALKDEKMKRTAKGQKDFQVNHP